MSRKEQNRTTIDTSAASGAVQRILEDAGTNAAHALPADTPDAADGSSGAHSGPLPDHPEAGRSPVITIAPIRIGYMRITLVGDSPLIVHAWSPKAKKEILDKQMKKAKQAKTAKDPHMDFCESLYWMKPSAMPEKPTMEDIATATFGFPSIAFKNAAVGGCRFSDGVKMTEARGAFHVMGWMSEIVAPPPVMRDDMVKVGQGTADIRFRGEFKEWKVILNVRYNQASLSTVQITNLFNLAGFGVGVGEWRPERDGNNGMFHVEESSQE